VINIVKYMLTESL